MNISVSASIYHQPLREVQPGARLDTLLCEEAHAPFDRLWWWQALERHCGLCGTLHGARSEAGEALLALHEAAPGHLVALANWYTFRFRPIVRGDPALLAPLAKALKPLARRITLDKVPDEDGSAHALVQAFRAAGWWVFCEPCDTNHVLEVRGRDFATYHATLPGPLRTTLTRKSGKVRAQVLTHFDADAWTQYEAIYAQSWKGEEGSPAFLRAFAEAEGAAGRLRLGLAHDASDPTGPAIAAQLWSLEGDTAFIHKLAHRESARALSPGSVLTAALLRHALDTDKVDLVDFGTGNDPYKRDWMNAERPRYRIEAFRPGALANVPHLAGRLAAHYLAARLPRG
ncbi:GNAT family N-acetyltransferase [Novosphingobium decolorationis]|uniref:GNAT family N-acetyltransferase n=1 Tax=Novosphingobium decolorationis TaxID=2698673 RepID=A0ABX8E0G7_9SPHN|nr:GNAT family N-acetyltransferase [Novosphingobium decolorationis]QVM82418.1 GNAT family N-acetyltransferase [Novosphingobium decolorationis]